jgi:hypothetical protein
MLDRHRSGRAVRRFHGTADRRRTKRYLELGPIRYGRRLQEHHGRLLYFSSLSGSCLFSQAAFLDDLRLS